MPRKTHTADHRAGPRRVTGLGRNKACAVKVQPWDGEPYGVLFQLNPCPMLIIDEEGTEFLDVNKAALRLYGYSRKAFLQLKPREIRPAEDVPMFLEMIRCRPKLRMRFLGIWRHCKRNGTVFEVSLIASSISCAGRKARLVMVHDMTERNRDEAARRAGEEQLRFALDASNAGIWSWDVASNTSTWDDNYHRLYGFEPHETRSFEIWINRVHPEDRARLVERIRVLVEPGSDDSWNEEFRAIVPGKGERWMGGLGCVERDENGRARRMTGINLDITERKRTVEALRELTSTLEKRVAERTAELSNASRLLKKEISERKQLEKEIIEVAERERQHFARELHDDICQKLAAIILMNTALSKQLGKSNAAEAREATQLSEMLRQTLVDTRKLAQGLHPDWHGSTGLVMALRTLANQTKSTVQCRFECGRSFVSASSGVTLQLYRIAQEAVSNALQHAQAREIVISLQQQRGRISLSIVDDGIGLSARKPGGLGIRNMTHRAQIIGATLLVQGKPGLGTRIVCSMRAGG